MKNKLSQKGSGRVFNAKEKILKINLLKTIQDTLNQTPLKKIVYTSIILPVISVGIVLLLVNHLPPEVPLFYGLAEGSEQLTSTLGLIIPSALAVAIVIFNLIVSLFFDNEFIKESLVVSAFAVTVFTTITTIKIVLLVGSF